MKNDDYKKSAQCDNCPRGPTCLSTRLPHIDSVGTFISSWQQLLRKVYVGIIPAHLQYTLQTDVHLETLTNGIHELVREIIQ